MKTLLSVAAVFFSIGSAAFVHAGSISGKVAIPGKTDLKNIIVYVEDIKGDFQPPRKRPEINHINLQFRPDRLGVMRGTTVDFPNSDPVLHSAFSISKTSSFELGIYGRGFEKFNQFRNPGLVEIFCHIHSHMHAYLMVLENPYFAMTSEDGSFTIADVPDGTHRVKAWASPSLSEMKSVAVEGSRGASVNFKLTAQE